MAGRKGRKRRSGPRQAPLIPEDKSPSDIVALFLTRLVKCSECEDDLEPGDFMRLEGKTPLCLSCADLDHLVFLESGNVALTRRSSKHSSTRAVVVRLNQRRRRYERVGILIEEAARLQAEAECLADADLRALRRERDAVRRERLDVRYISEFAAEILLRYPAVPNESAEAIADHACAKYSGRVGRAAFAKELDPKAVDLAVRAHVRHNHTEYDAFLAKGVARDQARKRVATTISEVLSLWRRRRR